MLETLYKLQRLEAEEAVVQASQKNCAEYRALRELKAEFERLKQNLLQRKEQIDALQQEIRPLSGDLDGMRQKLEQERAALYDGSVANIRELTAREAQINALTEKTAALTERQSQKQTDLRRLTQQAKTLQQRMTEQHQQFAEQYKEYEVLRENWQNALQALATDKQELLSQVAEQELAWYEEQKPLFAGSPVARLDANHVCDGCRTLVTPMLYKRTVFGERTRCEKCGRYLFLGDSN